MKFTSFILFALFNFVSLTSARAQPTTRDLLIAISEGDLERVTSLVDGGVGVDAPGELGTFTGTPLLFAASCLDHEDRFDVSPIIEYLLTKNVNVKSTISLGSADNVTALHLVLESYDRLVTRSVVNEKLVCDESKLLRVVTALVDKGADVNASYTAGGASFTPMSAPHHSRFFPDLAIWHTRGETPNTKAYLISKGAK